MEGLPAQGLLSGKGNIVRNRLDGCDAATGNSIDRPCQMMIVDDFRGKERSVAWVDIVADYRASDLRVL
jgi:hypothetical protein